MHVFRLCDISKSMEDLSLSFVQQLIQFNISMDINQVTFESDSRGSLGRKVWNSLCDEIKWDENLPSM